MIQDEVWVRDGSGESRECDGEMQSDWEQCPEGCVGGCGGVVREIEMAPRSGMDQRNQYSAVEEAMLKSETAADSR